MARSKSRAEQRRRARSGRGRSSGFFPVIAGVLAVGVALAVFIALRGAGGGASADPPGLVTVTATEFSYSPARIEATTDATLRLRNDGAVYHDLRIEGIDDFSLEALPDEDATGSIELEAGSYVLFCSVPGHREAGMVAELQVS
ncbi:MAG: hypothetical protein QF896_04800 [Acidimicrobiales bacterium]|nr:hypothetical protein [Acidimicrobiales bacterium]